jgi:hypothetical protein
MTHSPFASLARPFAILSLTSAGLLAGPAPPATPQTKDSPKLPAAEAAISSRPETVESRIVALKAALKVTPDQEDKWNGVAQAMRDNAGRIEKLLVEKRRIPPEKTTAVDDLKTHLAFAEARLDGLRHLASAFEALYESMTAEQKKNADQAFKR